MERRKLVAILVAVAVTTSVIVVAFYLNVGKSPPGKQPGTFLILANANGYNDSIDHGVPQNSWPVITVQKGTTVTITMYNSDVVAHGFQVGHYYDSPIQSVAPGKSFTLTFVADTAGSFRIYCSIFCEVHAYMQSGVLIVR
jgi:heme/copper-type cytochrome/quinol oxidase subunit 2